METSRIKLPHRYQIAPPYGTLINIKLSPVKTDDLYGFISYYVTWNFNKKFWEIDYFRNIFFKLFIYQLTVPAYYLLRSFVNNTKKAHRPVAFNAWLC